ncbi:MAG: hypothetical protein AAGI34_19445, partial [Pseudomonadota bacterium]
HIVQDVAELANRSEGRLLVIGFLHQAFERYAHRLGVSAQEDWAKIQGRFVDVPLVAGADEVIDLVGPMTTLLRFWPKLARRGNGVLVDGALWSVEASCAKGFWA